jgi:hypothetical protein
VRFIGIFPDKVSLLARVAEAGCGAARRVKQQIAGKPAGAKR